MKSDENSILNNPEADSLIDELAQSSSEAVKKLRGHVRQSMRVKVYVEPASLSARNGVRYQGVTGDISSGGTQILLARPLSIGDVYQISFERDELDIPPVYALCLRGRTVRPDAYEAGLRFLEPVTLPSSAEAEKENAHII